MHGLLGRAALPVDGDAGYRLGQARGQPRGTGDVAGLGPTVSTQPNMTSSTAFGSAWARASSSLMTCAPRSAGWAAARPPPRRVTGVRTASIMKASGLGAGPWYAARTRSILGVRDADRLHPGAGTAAAGAARVLRGADDACGLVALAGGDGDYGDGEAYRAVVRQLGRDGWLAERPAEFGGRGGTMLDQLIFTDEAATARVPVPFLTINTVGPTIMRFGSAAQKSFSCRRSRRARSTSRSGTPSRRPVPTWPRCGPRRCATGTST